MAPSRRLVLVLAALLVLALGSRALQLGAYPLIDPSEGRYAEIAREMVAGGDWVVPRLDPQRPFWGKPPLAFWLTALSFRALGTGELQARLPSFVAALGVLALTGALGARLGGGRGKLAVGLGAAVVLATTGLFLALAGTVLTDTVLAACVALAAAAFPAALSESGTRRRAWGLAFFAGLGLSVLAKGLVGPALVAVPVAGWTLAGGRERLGRVRRDLPWRTGLPLALALAVPWHVAAELRTPGFLEHYLVGEHLQRFVVPGWDGASGGNAHAEPRGTIWWFGLLGSLPWLPVLGAALWRGRGRPAPAGEWQGYLWLWFLAPMLLFSLAGNVMLAYVLPGLPALALLTALALSAARAVPGEAPWPLRRRVLTGTALAVPAATVGALLLVLPVLGAERSQKALAELFLAAADRDAALVYIDDMPHTGDFYTGGRATRIPPSGDAVRRALRDDRQQYFAVRPEHLSRMREDTELARTELLGRFGEWMLRREAHPRS